MTFSERLVLIMIMIIIVYIDRKIGKINNILYIILCGVAEINLFENKNIWYNIR